MYRMFYNYKETGDVLFIKFSDETPDKTISYDEHVIGLYKDTDLVEIDIVNMSKISKIFYEGEIENPSEEFITLINHILVNAGMDALEG